jgi:rhodanese-related sulfurtransferase
MASRTTQLYTVLLLLLVCGVIYYMTSTPTEITPQEAKANRRRGLYDYIVDVRTDREWTEGHLTDTLHIPIGELVSELPQQIPDRSARILFVCKKGIRASAVVVIAHKLGYKNVHSMIGNYKELME